MVIKVSTQYAENYDIDGYSPPFSYWKFKGGNDYYVLGSEGRPANAVARVHAALVSRQLDPLGHPDPNPIAIEFVRDWEDLGSEGLIPKEARDADRVFILGGAVNPRPYIGEVAVTEEDAVDDLLTKTYGTSA